MSEAISGTDIRINVTLNLDITGATTKQIAYMKPGNTDYVYLDATVSNPTIGEMYVDLPYTLTTTPGRWLIFPWVIQSDGKRVSAQSKSFNLQPLGLPEVWQGK
jgi:hypothetical protein